MKPFAALALLEFADIPLGYVATDAALKASPVAWVRCGTIGAGRFLTLLGGTPAAVDEAFRAGAGAGTSALLDSLFLADVEERLIAAVLGAPIPHIGGSLAIIETRTATAAVRAAEFTLKGTRVTLSELRLADSGLAGKGILVLRGELPDLEAALDIAVATAGARTAGLAARIIAAPHEGLAEMVGANTRFYATTGLHLDGEHD